MIAYCLKTCDTCRKALKELSNAGIPVTVVDVRADGLSADVIAQVVARFGEKAVNRASTTWRGLSESERAMPLETLLALHPTLMKRPVIHAGSDWYQGWTPANRQALLGTQ